MPVSSDLYDSDTKILREHNFAWFLKFNIFFVEVQMPPLPLKKNKTK